MPFDRGTADGRSFPSTGPDPCNRTCGFIKMVARPGVTPIRQSGAARPVADAVSASWPTGSREARRSAFRQLQTLSPWPGPEGSRPHRGSLRRVRSAVDPDRARGRTRLPSPE